MKIGVRNSAYRLAKKSSQKEDFLFCRGTLEKKQLKE